MSERDRSSQRAHKGKADELVFMALGGLGEIGMNAYLYGYGPPNARSWLMVDLGVTFPHESEPGADVVLPDLRYIVADRKNLAGLILTHAHEDHIGAVLDLWPSLECPIFATPFTAGMVKTKVGEAGRTAALPIRTIPLGGRFKAGVFDIEFVGLTHSIPEPNGIAIRTPAGLVFHTGDWKFDSTPVVGRPHEPEKLKSLGDEGVLAIVGDSTNAMREGRSASEADVARALTKIIVDAPHCVAVTLFASNVARIASVAEAARKSGRTLVVAGRALHRIIEVAKETGYLPESFTYLDQQRFSDLPRNKVLVLCTGSQGESRAAVARIAEGEHPDISLDKGDLIIFSSRTIPGNEKAVAKIQNGLARLGVDLVTDADALVHVTGHPRRDELKDMYAWLRPKIAVPMHGEARHIREHAKLARACGVNETFTIVDGEMLKLWPGEASVIDEAPVGRLYRDGNLIVPDVEGPVKARRKLSFVGIAVVSLVLSRRGDVLGEPGLVLEGIPAADAGGEAMREVVFDAIDGTFRSIPPKRRSDLAMLQEAVQRAVRAAINEAWGKKPVVKVLLSVVEAKG
ncbi:RNA-metabolising metallo-beta-lactamase [Hyphomicrobium denitrificans 1NES1]|uniref:RNA-metabolising metallo-beta-lactamase n=1 Tax=Hyphomicrobium denitrificans 1NES1 TaxID=670307 RepID=N0B5I8_9HYPH|nr:ribonuclease J [Hyphomicrobium denitrificans]AGK57462.1 RNA-metabolising metallo-beta-lactamase [Hyphomicrobium denitrificans 1NES1]